MPIVPLKDREPLLDSLYVGAIVRFRLPGAPAMLVESFDVGERLDGPNKGEKHVVEISVVWFTATNELRRSAIMFPDALVVQFD